MHEPKLLILDRDKDYIKRRIKEIESEILALGPEFHDAFNQTSETWHDNAPFEVVRDKQAVLNAEIHNLKNILRNSAISLPRQPLSKVGIGSMVKVTNHLNDETTEYHMAGDWTPYAGEKLSKTNAIIISRKSPLGHSFYGLETGEQFSFRGNNFTIISIDSSR
jgi:transcription elongation GreA/GreB family factor